jgi:hypothetical protein
MAETNEKNTTTETKTNEKASSGSDTLLVRLKPYNPKRGHTLQRYCYSNIIFRTDRGWYRVEAKLAAELRSVQQVHTNQDSAPAFDVCTEEEARAIDEREADAAETRKSAGKSNVVRASDVTEAPMVAGMERRSAPNARRANGS